jgi:hypothetical protein
LAANAITGTGRAIAMAPINIIRGVMAGEEQPPPQPSVVGQFVRMTAEHVGEHYIAPAATAAATAIGDAFTTAANNMRNYIDATIEELTKTATQAEIEMIAENDRQINIINMELADLQENRREASKQGDKYQVQAVDDGIKLRNKLIIKMKTEKADREARMKQLRNELKKYQRKYAEIRRDLERYESEGNINALNALQEELQQNSIALNKILKELSKLHGLKTEEVNRMAARLA